MKDLTNTQFLMLYAAFMWIIEDGSFDDSGTGKFYQEQEDELYSKMRAEYKRRNLTSNDMNEIYDEENHYNPA